MFSILDAEWGKVHLQTKWSLERCYMSGMDATDSIEIQVQTSDVSDATSNSPPCSEPATDSPAPLCNAGGDQDILAATNSNSPCLALNQSQNELPDDPNPMATVPSTHSSSIESGSHFLEVTNVPPLL